MDIIDIRKIIPPILEKSYIFVSIFIQSRKIFSMNNIP